ncbi:Hypothetical protein DPCES_1379 [Desulfitobacterium hafniense]|uniref:Uncharacterized protein n=1 Tax=Desulfitobacterium hafniense TaxID=49338 RepID=A0A098B076_DESHA|nr:hypothetical protein [Desulfitobacterium hafniense]CDX01266.1 Hypothetical protein DPCES_1379 [Desulfitobacterium hafniense]
MTTVNCYQPECVNNKNDICTLDSIHIAFDEFCLGNGFYLCADYKNVFHAPEYQERYFIRVKDTKTRREEKARRNGKRLELFGMVFYTENDTRYDKDWWLTEEKTGLGVSKKYVLENPDKVRKVIEEVTPVSELPDEEVKCHD